MGTVPASGSHGMLTVPCAEPETMPVTAALAGEAPRTDSRSAASSPAGMAEPGLRRTGQLHRAPIAMPSSTQASAVSSPAAVAGRTGTATRWSEKCGSDVRATKAVPPRASSSAPRAAVSSEARCTRPGPAAAAAQLRAAGGSLVTQIRASQTAIGSVPAAAKP